MTSSRPYLVKALYEWILDNNCTPHILVWADAEGVDVPRTHVQNGQIVLNIHPSAVVSLLMDNTAISFNARFNGIETDIYIPMGAITGMVTRENGQGMMFDFVEPPTPPRDTPTPPSGKGKTVNIKSARKPTLKVVK
jgi:stringent starvation protein B